MEISLWYLTSVTALQIPQLVSSCKTLPATIHMMASQSSRLQWCPSLVPKSSAAHSVMLTLSFHELPTLEEYNKGGSSKVVAKVFSNFLSLRIHSNSLILQTENKEPVWLILRVIFLTIWEFFFYITGVKIKIHLSYFHKKENSKLCFWNNRYFHDYIW